jgi:hypothetical protein
MLEAYDAPCPRPPLMQAVAIPRFGSAEVLEQLELPAPSAGPGEVAIDDP